MRGAVFGDLVERCAGVAGPTRAQIEMRIKVDDGQTPAQALFLPVLAQALVRAERNLVAATQHNRTRTRIEQIEDSITERGLCTF